MVPKIAIASVLAAGTLIASGVQTCEALSAPHVRGHSSQAITLAYWRGGWGRWHGGWGGWHGGCWNCGWHRRWWGGRPWVGYGYAYPYWYRPYYYGYYPPYYRPYYSAGAPYYPPQQPPLK